MKKNITLSENKLRETIKKTIAESLSENGKPLFYVEDEADDGIYYTTSDLEDAKAWVTRQGGNFIVKNENDEEVWRNQPGVSYKFESIQMNESQLRETVKSVISNILKESFFDKLYKAHVPSNEEIPNPTVKDVIERNGWIIKTTKPSNGGTLFQIEQKTGAFGNTEGTLSLDELAKDINTFGKQCQILNRGRISGDSMAEAEKAIIYIQN